MSLYRRDVLKAIAAPFAAGTASAFSFPGKAAAESSGLEEKKEAAMNSRPLMTVSIAAAPPQKLGAVPHGVRTFIPVAGGSFEGPRLRGRIVPGGGDWLLLRPDGVLELDLRITLETEDHALISMTFQGLRHGPPEVIAALNRGEVVDPARYYFRTVPGFETSAEAYAFLNRIVTVGVGESRPDGAVHKINEIL
jgi:hypothetical protein